ncbi:MAG: NAD(P)-dependent oxidoreductase [Bernardetiaceae bacterium]|jgi:UDP-glucose 4-epimerase|nr:NAD(P)-dependent oxidoreductase [Bernardetiaceae bacterium]
MKTDVILVTGGSGFIGSHLCKQLVEAGHRVVNLDLYPRRPEMSWLLGREIEKAIVFEPGSAADEAQLLAVVQRHRVNKIAHLASMVNDAATIKSPKSSYTNMLGATINVLEVCAKAGIERLLNCSSIGVIPIKQYEPIDANHPVLLGQAGPAAGAYGAGKVAGEAFCWAYREAFGLDFVTIRPSAAYGFISGNLIYLNQFLEAALRGEPLHYPSGANNPRDYTHVHDIAGIAKAGLEVPPGQLKDRVFYAASGMDPLVTAGQVAQIVCQMVPSAQVGIEPGLNLVDTLEVRMRGVLDVKPVTEQLGYQFKYQDIRQGMAEHADRYCEWLVAQGQRPADRTF